MRPALGFTGVLAGVLGLTLVACAPAAGSTGRVPAPALQAIDGGMGDLRAAFSPSGVAWVVGGQACVARIPDFVPRCPRVGKSTDVAWHDQEAWATLPALGLALTLDHAPQSVSAGAVVALSSQAIYRQDGSTLTYSGAATGGTNGRPAQVVTGGDGLDYALLAGQLVRVADGTVLDIAPKPFLLATPSGVTTAEHPTVFGDYGSYRLSQGQLERLDSANKVISRIEHGPGLVGLVGELVVTVSPQGEVRRFTPALAELN